MAKDLAQTKGKFKLTGIVSGVNGEHSFREGFTKKTEVQYKTLQFYVETSKTNKVRVELFGQEREEVTAYSSKAQATKKIPWSQRSKSHGEYKVLGTNLFLEGTGDKKTRVVKVEFDAIDYIQEHLVDGDVVRVEGTIDFQNYRNDAGDLKKSHKFNITSIKKQDIELDFTSPDFKEEAIFEQEIVVVEAIKEDKKLLIDAKIIKYKGEIVDTEFVVDGEELPKLATNIKKKFSYGDTIKVFGHIVNQTIVTEGEEEVGSADEDDWGGDNEIQEGFNNNFITTYISELQIRSVDSTSWEKKRYNEDDLYSEDEDAFNGNVGDDDFGDDEEDDDLPFA